MRLWVKSLNKELISVSHGLNHTSKLQRWFYRAKNFVRWLRGTCTPAPPVMQGEDPFIYSYYLDIGRLPRVLQLLIRIQETIQNLLGRVWEHLKRYAHQLLQFLGEDKRLLVRIRTN